MIARYRVIDGAVRHLFGWRPEAGDHRLPAAPPKLTAAELGALPRRVDNSARWPAIKNQFEIGACVANAICECYEFFQSLDARLPLSRRYVYEYGRFSEGTPLTEDSGMQVRTGLRVLTDRGAPSESDYPYSDNFQDFVSLPPPELDAKAAEHKALFWYPCPDLFTLKAALAQGFPAMFGFSCPENMFSAEC